MRFGPVAPDLSFCCFSGLPSRTRRLRRAVSVESMSFDVVFMPTAIIVTVTLPARLVGFNDACAWRQCKNLQDWCDISRASPLSPLKPVGSCLRAATVPSLVVEELRLARSSPSPTFVLCATGCKELGSGGTFSARPLA
jgi:hypothetical protein